MKPSFLERASLATHPIAQKLFALMHRKETNLSCALDVTDSKELLKLTDAIGPEICVLKTHIDILQDFTPDVTERLKELAEKHQFLIFEDRKFADIGSTVLEQYRGGIYHIADWADLTNAHILPGPGIIQALKQEGLKQNRALLLLAEMSSSGNFLTGDYTQAAVELARSHSDFVIGFIAQRQLTEDPTYIHFTPGIQLASSKDGLGQQFSTPETALSRGTDVLIVGRGIYQNKDPKDVAKLYREHGWNALQSLQLLS